MKRWMKSSDTSWEISISKVNTFTSFFVAFILCEVVPHVRAPEKSRASPLLSWYDGLCRMVIAWHWISITYIYQGLVHMFKTLFALLSCYLTEFLYTNYAQVDFYTHCRLALEKQISLSTKAGIETIAQKYLILPNSKCPW